MKKLFFLLLFLSLPSVVHAQFSQTQINYLQTMISQWLAAGSSLGGAGHTIQEDGSSLAQQTILNFTGAGITCTDAGGKTVCNVPAGSVDQSADYSWTGAQSFLRNKFEIKDNTDPTKIITFNNSANTTKTARDYTLPDASTTLAGIGVANTWGAANTWSTGAQDMGSATSFKIPTSAGAGPTANGLIAYDSTSNTFEWGANGSNKIALADPGANGFLDRTAAGTVVQRTLTVGAGSANYLTITNGGGGGVPTFNLGANVLTTDRANTVTTGDTSFAAASSFTVPTSAGAAPTANGRLAYDSTANRYKFGVNGSTITIPSLAEVQPLNANLSTLAAITGANNLVPIFTAAATMTTGTLPSCVDSGGNHLNYDNTTHAFSCGTSSTGGLSKLTTAKYLIATGLTSADTSGALSESAGVVNAANGLTVGDVATNYLTLDTSAVTGAKTWTIQNYSGTVRTSTGAFSAGNVITTDANGQLVDGGTAGTGTWTDSSTNTGTNKTLVATEAGGTNTLTTGINAFFDAASLTPDVAGKCALQTAAAINGGPIVPVMTCEDNDASTFDGQIMLTHAVATVTFTLTVNDVDSSSEHFAGTFTAMCRNNNTAVNGTFGTGQTIDITMVAANNNYTGTTPAVTPNGTCSAGATLFFRYTVLGSTTNTDGGNARILGVLLKQAS